MDPVSLIFLVIAVVLFMRLRNILGTRTGHEEPPQDQYYRDQQNRDDGQDPSRAPTADDVGDNVISLPGRAEVEAEAEEKKQKQLEKIAPAGSALNSALVQLMAMDKSFDPEGFISGAKMAYEMVVTAFAEGDRKTLKKLLAADVFNGFTAAIDERENLDHRVDFTFVGINKASILEAELSGKEANITVRFISSITSCTKDDIGHVIEGDPNAVEEVTDIWTFSRTVSSRNPNWKLVATEAAQ
ncbi:Tim44/TimA family putative adaptor protein [Cohaesibacter gelatinilyticus]|uniref:Predicted lipid-binding transport protein, Tim44 family n=1 Tax=Cohaesibacter gelatinilyticus TaxID=372072 RepID=A0A285PDT7_9HYPH|nr:Tim44/TimA family putative adaptor protein [Cohaesibacter gelatinilyticus]SNZ19899.1 Predicted lipid-binding transport protein, Tim44 family [Cohaesibacter gelatinilyticus]HAT87018.1 calcium-binding protein [Hyphomicrobiales bacterium]